MKKENLKKSFSDVTIRKAVIFAGLSYEMDYTGMFLFSNISIKLNWLGKTNIYVLAFAEKY